MLHTYIYFSNYFIFFFFFNATATTEIYTLSLHDALPISCPSATISPQSGVGSCAPSPRNDRAETVRITPPTSSDTWTIRGVIEFGRTWRKMIRHREMPRARQLSM